MKVILLILMLCVCSCTKQIEPKETIPIAGSESSVDKLFTVDGCTTYRFYDGGYIHYFVKCSDIVMTTSTHSESCGKGCTRTITDEIETVSK